MPQLPAAPGPEAPVLTVEKTWEAEGLPVLAARVTLPQPEGLSKKAARRICRYYQTQCRAFLRHCQTRLVPGATEARQAALEASAPLTCRQAELTFRTTYADERLWSLYTQSREPADRRGTLLRRWGDTWDLESGLPLSLSDFFPGGRWRRLLPALAAGEIRRQEAAGLARYPEGWQKRLRRAFRPTDFYLTGEGLVFFYPMCSIAPAIEGIPAFLVPYGEEGLRLPGPECRDRAASESGDASPLLTV